jgi:hypothetical protein
MCAISSVPAAKPHTRIRAAFYNRRKSITNFVAWIGNHYLPGRAVRRLRF